MVIISPFFAEADCGKIMLKCAAAVGQNKPRKVNIPHTGARMSQSPWPFRRLLLLPSSYEFAIRHTSSRRCRAFPRLRFGLVFALCFAALAPAAPPQTATDKPDLLREMKGHTERVLSVAFSPNGRYILSAGQ